MKNLLFATMMLLAACTQNKPTAKDLSNQAIVFVGTYTKDLGFVNGKATGIYTCRMDTLTGELTVVDSTKDIQNPSFLTISSDKKYLYAVAENGGDSLVPFGSVFAYKITEGSKLLKINEVSSYGAAPCYISVSDKQVFVANYSTGNVTLYGVKPDGGLTDSLKVNKRYKEMVWAHMIVKAPKSAYIFSVDKGSDRIYSYLGTYADDGIGQMSYFSTAKGAGPRHLDFHPNGKMCYVINELNSTINTYSFDAEKGKLKELQSISTLPADFKGANTTAEIFVHPNGRFVYGSNRGHNSIAIFKITNTGTLELVGHEPTQGAIPRSFMITPNGKLLLVANQISDNVVAFSIDETTGKLKPTGKNSRVMTPVCLKML